MNIKSALIEYGLSENEIQVYLALLKLGESTAQNIAKTSRLPRTTTYHLLESLIQKALVSFVIKETIKHFQAAEPKKLIRILEEKKKIIQEIVPELANLKKTIKEKPKVTVFEGLKGIRSVLKDVLEENKTIYHYGDIISMQKVFSYAFPQYIKQRVKRKIPIKIICKKQEAHKDLIKTAKKEFREFVFVSKDFKSSVFIYADKVAVFSIKTEPYYVVVMENKNFYDSQKTMFDLLWRTAKK